MTPMDQIRMLDFIPGVDATIQKGIAKGDRGLEVLISPFVFDDPYLVAGVLRDWARAQGHKVKSKSLDLGEGYQGHYLAVITFVGEGEDQP